MNTRIFDGHTFAAIKEAQLSKRLFDLRSMQTAHSGAVQQVGKQAPPKIVAFLFTDDPASVTYSSRKHEAAARIGITYELHYITVVHSIASIQEQIQIANQDPSVTGIIIQKPRRSIWQESSRVDGNAKHIKAAFDIWWELLVSTIDPQKDVDGLHPDTFAAIQAGDWQEKGKVLPATAKAVCWVILEAMETTFDQDTFLDTQLGLVLKDKAVAIIGRSDLLGKPLHALLSGIGVTTELLGKAGLERLREQKRYLHDFDVVVSATGVAHVITAEDIASNAIVIDVGEPNPDVEFVSVAAKARFVSPVPGGVGPVTVQALMENGISLHSKQL